MIKQREIQQSRREGLQEQKKNSDSTTLKTQNSSVCSYYAQVFFALWKDAGGTTLPGSEDGNPEKWIFLMLLSCF